MFDKRKNTTKSIPEQTQFPLWGMFLCGFILIGCYGLLFRKHFAVDTYGTLVNPDTHWKAALSLGRLTPALIERLLEACGIMLTLNARIVLFFLFTYISYCLILQSLSSVNSFSDFITYTRLVVAVGLIFVNVLYVEWFLFPDGAIMFGSGMLFSALAVFHMRSDFNIKKIFFSATFVFLSVNSYQSNVSMCFVLLVTIRIIQHKFFFSKELIKELLVIMAIVLLAAFSNLLIMRFLQATTNETRAPIASLSRWIENLKIIAWDQVLLMKSAKRLMPDYLTVAAWGVGGGLFIIQLIKAYKINLLRKIDIFASLATVVLLYLSVSAPQIISGNIWLAHRTLVPFFTVLSCLFIMSFNVPSGLSKISSKILGATLVVFMMVSLVQCQRIQTDHLITNRIDIMEASAVLKSIEEYEEAEKICVNQIACVPDRSPTYIYPGILASMDINVRAMAYWAYSFNVINYLAGGRFTRAEIDPQTYENKVKNTNWDSLNLNEQLWFEGNTAYLALY